jgi:hypothetical protein
LTDLVCGEESRVPRKNLVNEVSASCETALEDIRIVARGINRDEIWLHSRTSEKAWRGFTLRASDFPILLDAHNQYKWASNQNIGFGFGPVSALHHVHR